MNISRGHTFCRQNMRFLKHIGHDGVGPGHLYPLAPPLSLSLSLLNNTGYQTITSRSVWGMGRGGGCVCVSLCGILKKWDHNICLHGVHCNLIYKEGESANTSPYIGRSSLLSPRVIEPPPESASVDIHTVTTKDASRNITIAPTRMGEGIVVSRKEVKKALCTYWRTAQDVYKIDYQGRDANECAANLFPSQ